MDLTRMTDILGFRIIVPSLAVIEDVAGVVTRDGQFEVRDYIAGPQASGYRSLHLYGSRSLGRLDTLSGDFSFEVQVRTVYQHAWASIVEGYGERAKEGTGTAIQIEFFRQLSERITEWEESNVTEPQSDKLSSDNGPSFVVINVSPPGDPDITRFGDDWEAGLQHLAYLENRATRTGGQRLVLIGIPNSPHDLEISYSSYYRTPDLAELPSGVLSGLEFPMS